MPTKFKLSGVLTIRIPTFWDFEFWDDVVVKTDKAEFKGVANIKASVEFEVNLDKYNITIELPVKPKGAPKVVDFDELPDDLQEAVIKKILEDLGLRNIKAMETKNFGDLGDYRLDAEEVLEYMTEEGGYDIKLIPIEVR